MGVDDDAHYLAMAFEHQMLSLNNAIRTCSTEPLRVAYERVRQILLRPRCVRCTREIAAASGVCFLCGAPQPVGVTSP